MDPKPVDDALAVDLEGGPQEQESVPSSTDHSPSSTRAPSVVLQEPKAAEAHGQHQHHHKHEQDDQAFLVHLEPSEDPKNMSLWRKWIIVLVVSTSALCDTSASSMAAYADAGISKEFGVSEEVAILGVTVFLLGLGCGPLFVGPMSEVYGRNIVYRCSFASFFALSFVVDFAPNIAVYIIFRYITGLCGAAFMSVAGGSVTDLFIPTEVAIPVAIYTLLPFIGSVLGPIVSGFINQNANWRWTFWTLTIWIFVQTLAIFLLVPETYEPVLLKQKAAKLRKTTGDSRYYAPLDRREMSMLQAIKISCTTPFKLIIFDRMALLLDTWTALILAILYLAFEAWPFIFEDKHGFNLEDTGLALIGLGIGMVIGCIINIWMLLSQRRKLAAQGRTPTPEDSLVQGCVGALLVPLSLVCISVTTFSTAPWILPILASVMYGAGFILCFCSTFTYLVSAFRPIAASALAGNAFMRACAAGGFPLFADQMYRRLGTEGATGLLAGIMLVAAPLPFVFYKIGARLRAKSPFASH